MGKTLAEKVWDEHVVRQRTRESPTSSSSTSTSSTR